MRYALHLLSLVALLAACDAPDPARVETGNLTLLITNVVGSQPLKLGDTYRNGTGEAFTPTTFDYYVSNLKLTRTDGSVYTVPQDSSYFLVKQNVAATQRITLRNVPAADYRSVSFIIGVDSLRSTMDVSRRTGVLDPAGDHTSANSMYWSWNSGYIFLKLEGTSPAAPTDATGQNTFRYHIGFFGGRDTRTINNIKTVPLALPMSAQVTTAQTPIVNLEADVLKVFDGPTPLSIRANPEIMISLLSANVANNYAQMFRVKNVTMQ